MTEARLKLTVEEYLAEVLSLVAPLDRPERLPLAAAAGRTLAAPVTSRGPVPAFTNSAMDGFAVRHADLSAGMVLRIVADLPAGSGEDPVVHHGECARIMTGAPVPTRTDTVVAVELTSPGPGPGLVRVDEVPPAGVHVRHTGEDLAAGDLVLSAGTTLGPRELSAAAAAGWADVLCAGRPVVGIASTGDELVPPGGTLDRGQIFESNATYLAAAVARDGADVRRSQPVRDTADALSAVLDELAAEADLVVLSGGVSVGDHDVTRLTLSGARRAAFRHVRLQPGKPQGWALWRVGDREVPVIGLPGNPLSAAVSYELFVRPALARLLGAALPDAWAPAIAGEGWTAPAGRRQIIPVRLTVDAAGRRIVFPAHRHGSASHMVTSLAAADALAQVGEDVTRVEPGDILAVRSLR